MPSPKSKEVTFVYASLQSLWDYYKHWPGRSCA